jgi:hypothetical protein
MRNVIACLRRLHGKTGACLVDGKYPVALVTRGVVIMKSGTPSHALWHLFSLISWLAVVCFHGGITRAETVTIVNWPRSDNKVGGNANLNGTSTTGDFDYDGDSLVDSRRTIRAFSESTRLSPFSTSPSGETLTFFGGYQSIWVGGVTGTPLERAMVRNVGTDPITVVTAASATLPSALQGINVWLASSFLDVDPAADTVAFTAGSQLRMVFSADGTAPTFRFALKQDGQYYLSQAAYAPGTHVLSDPSSATLWATYDPSLDLNFDETAASFSARSFTDVQAVGVYYGLSQSAVNERVGYRLSEFSATAAVVPEPGSLAGVACGAVAVGFWVRRRRSAR